MAGGKDDQEETSTVGDNEEIRKEPPTWLMDNIAVASKSAAKTYTVYLGFLAYCALTVISTTDRQIMLNEQAHLPIVNLDVPLNGFFWLSPILLLLFFVYFQIYLHRLRSLISELQMNYPSVERGRLYPWILNIADEPEPGKIGKLQVFAANFTLWISLPILLTLNAFWYIRKHEPVLSYVVGLLTLVGIIVVVCFWWSYDPKHRKKSIPWLIIGCVSITCVLAFQAIAVFQLVQYAREGGRHEWIKPFVCVDLSYQKLITEPEKDQDYQMIYWGNLKHARLEGANLENSILKRCDMRGVQLLEANLPGAVLQRANLTDANLTEANLMKANLQGADLTRCDLRGANLGGAYLMQANFKGADLRDGDLRGADLEKANLQGANLSGANLGEANLRVAIFTGADLQRASLKGVNGNASQFQGANLREVDLRDSAFNEVNLENAELSGANLRDTQFIGANLRKVNLQRADLTGVNLQGADLRDGNLQGSVLKVNGQLSEVKTLYGAKLDSDIRNQIKRTYPHLLEKPKD